MSRRYSTYLLLFYCSFIFANNLSDIQHEAVAGDSVARYKLGNNYYVGGGFAQDYKMALHWYSLAAEQDCTDAQFALGLTYSRVHGVAQDFKKAFNWCSKAAKQRHVDAQFTLGQMYH